MCAAAPKGPQAKPPEVVAPTLELVGEDSAGEKRGKLGRGRQQVTNAGTGLAIPVAGSTAGRTGSAGRTGLAIPGSK